MPYSRREVAHATDEGRFQMFDENMNIADASNPLELSEEQLTAINGGVVISIIGILVG
jgi:hypothetical protein